MREGERLTLEANVIRKYVNEARQLSLRVTFRSLDSVETKAPSYSHEVMQLVNQIDSQWREILYVVQEQNFERIANHYTHGKELEEALRVLIYKLDGINQKQTNLIRRGTFFR